MSKPTLCIDFDGVLHSYISGWKGADVTPDPPVPGALKFLDEATKLFTVAVFSSRTHQPGGLDAMQKWLSWHARVSDTILPKWLDEIQWPETKPAAFLSLDDRAITFDGTWPDPHILLAFKPWNKRQPSDDSVLNVSFKVDLLPSGDLVRLRLKKDGCEMVFTKEQAQSLANEINRSLGGGR